MQIAVPNFYCTNIFDMHSREWWDFQSSQHSPPCISASLQTFALQHSTSSSTNSRQRIVLGERKKGRLVVAFWWVFVWILFNCNLTCPWPAMFLHAPPPWITNPTRHAAPPCGRNLTGKKWSRKIYHSHGEFCIFLFAQILNWLLLCLTYHLLPRPPPCINYNPHALCRPLLGQKSNN